jgi:hypothetical protein
VASVGKKTAPRSQSQQVDQQHVLVDEVSPHQRQQELSAPERYQILARPFLELGHGIRGVPLEQRGFAPRQRLLKRRRCDVRDVLLDVV